MVIFHHGFETVKEFAPHNFTYKFSNVFLRIVRKAAKAKNCFSNNAQHYSTFCPVLRSVASIPLASKQTSLTFFTNPINRDVLGET